MGEAAPDRRGRAGGLGLSPARTVRDATFDVLRRRGLTTLFSNPGSTEVPFLAGLAGRPALRARAARGLGRRARDRVRDRARASRRSRSCTRRPGSATRVGALATARVNRAPLVVARRPAGPAAPRLRAVPGRPARRARGRVPGLGRAAGAPAGGARRDRARVARGFGRTRAGARDRADGRLGRGRRGGSRGRGRGPRVCAAAAVDPAAVSELAAFLAGASVAGARRRRGSGRRGDVGRARRARGAARRAGVPGVVRRACRLSAGPPAVRRLPAGRPAAAAREARAVRRGPRRRRAGLPAVAVRARAASWIAQTRIALVSEDADEVHRSPVELAVLAPPAAVCRELAALVPAA